MNDHNYWADRWRNQNTPWDLGRPHPNLGQLVENVAPTGRVYIPACGRAHEGDWFAKRGHTVVAEDIAPEAIEEARRLYATTEGLTLRVGNLFEVGPGDKGAYDIVFDRAAFCAMSPDRWPAYLRAAWDRLKPGGLFLSLPFSQSVTPDPVGPPFFIEKDAWKRLVGSLFTVEYLSEHPVSRPGSTLKAELVTIARK